MDSCLHDTDHMDNDHTYLDPPPTVLKKKGYDCETAYLSLESVQFEPNLKNWEKNSANLSNASQDSEIINRLLHSKELITSTLIRYILNLVNTRTAIRQDSSANLEKEILKCRNQLLELERFYLGQNRAADEKRRSIEQKLFDLYREKRAEQASCWRDQLWLKRDLTAGLKEYLDIQRRENLINEVLKDDYSVNSK